MNNKICIRLDLQNYCVNSNYPNLFTFFPCLFHITTAVPLVATISMELVSPIVS